VGVAVVGLAVGRPPGVSDPEGAGRRPVALEHGVELGELALALDDREIAVDEGDAGRVVPAVLEAAKALEDHGKRMVRAYVTDDSAHGGSEASRVGCARSSAVRRQPTAIPPHDVTVPTARPGNEDPSVEQTILD
jgi:hypothetical protein